jgi:ammonium transporter Rh
VEGHRFDPVHIQNSVLAGGVTMGVAADLNVTPAGAMGSGFIVGVISVLGFRFLQPFLNNKFGIQDTCGVHNLHGMPGICSGLVGVFVTIDTHSSHPNPTLPDAQAAYQIAAVGITFGNV